MGPSYQGTSAGQYCPGVRAAQANLGLLSGLLGHLARASAWPNA
jgi:hypothetical protein